MFDTKVHSCEFLFFDNRMLTDFVLKGEIEQTICRDRFAPDKKTTYYTRNKDILDQIRFI